MWRSVCSGLLASGLGLASMAQPLYYAQHQSGDDPHLPYIIELLTTALDEANLPYQLQANPLPMNQSRMIRSLQNNDSGVQLVWMMTDTEREQQLIPIRVPIFKGLIGWRLALIRAVELERFALLTAEEWPELVAGQMSDWPDYSILAANGMDVQGSQIYDSLFAMLKQRRFDYFPRSVIEILDEWRTRPDLDLAIEPHWMLYYPTAFYFFVGPEQQDLANEIEQALLNLHALGLFDEIFERHMATKLEALALEQRQVIRLDNPFLPRATPIEKTWLWQAVP